MKVISLAEYGKKRQYHRIRVNTIETSEGYWIETKRSPRTWNTKTERHSKAQYSIAYYCDYCGVELFADWYVNNKNEIPPEIAEDMDSVRAIKRCPVCGKSALKSQKEWNLVRYVDPAKEYPYSKLENASKELARNHGDALVRKIVSSNSVSKDNSKVGEWIKSSPDKLKEYLSHIINLETLIIFLSRRIPELTAEVDDIRRLTLSKLLDPVMAEFSESEKSFLKSHVVATNAAEETLRTITDIKRQLENDENEIVRLSEAIERGNEELAALEQSHKATAERREKKLKAVQDVKKKLLALDGAPVARVVPFEERVAEVPVPVEPILEEPNLFNRRRVLAENEARTQRFKEEMLRYNAVCEQLRYETAAAREAAAREEEKRRSALADLRRQFTEWDKELCAIAEELDQIDKEKAKLDTTIEAQENARNALRKKIQEEKSTISSAKKKAEKEKTAALLEAKESLFKATCQHIIDSNWEKGTLYSSTLGELDQAADMLKQAVETRNRLYALDVVYIKYRDIVSLTSIYEYLDSGRCTSLEGPYGAYNIYENEILMGRVASKLDIIIAQLEEIKKNQLMICSILERINDSLDSLDKKLGAAVKELNNLNVTTENIYENSGVLLDTANALSDFALQTLDNTFGILANTETVADRTSRIASSSEEILEATREISASSKRREKHLKQISYNTAVSAEYAKKNAELTEALGFLVAFK